MKKNLLPFITLFIIIFTKQFAVAQTQPANAGFENWTGSPAHPVGWVSTDDVVGIPGNNLAQDMVNFVEGTSSAKLRTDSFAGSFLAEGDLNYGTGLFIASPPSITYYGTPFTDRPDSFTFSYRFIPVAGDSGAYNCRFYKWNGSSRDTIGNTNGSNWLLSTGGNWVYESIGIYYTSSANPDTISIRLHSSAKQAEHQGTEIWFDNLKLVYNSAGVFENSPIRSEVSLYPNPSAATLHLLTNENFTGCKAEIFDLSGKLVLDVTIDNNSFAVASLERGNYAIKFTDKSGKTRSGKFEVMR